MRGDPHADRQSALAIGELDRLRYRGWVGCEYRQRGATDDDLGWAQTSGVTL